MVASGHGSKLIDIDGNRYVDFLYNYTSLVLGHAHPAVVEAVAAAAARGTAYAAPTELQVELAERLVARLPSAERVRFCSSGTEAAMLGVRCARAATGRPLIAKIAGGYHGSYDALDVRLVDAQRPPRGVAPRPSTLVVGLDDPVHALATLERHASELAAVLIEPVLGHSGLIPVPHDFLLALSELTHRVGALLVFDEVATFRLGPGGLQRELGIEPGVTMLGKIIGGGLPVGAIAGRAELLDLFAPTTPDFVAHNGTYNGNPLTLAAGIATLDLLDTEAYARLDALGERLVGGLTALSAASLQLFQVTCVGSLLEVHFADRPITDGLAAKRSDAGRHCLFHLGFVNRGFLIAPRCELVVSLATTEEEIDALLGAAAEVLA